MNRRNTRLAALACWLAVPWCAVAYAKEKPWVEVRSPHFRVLTDGSDGQARRVAREFEQMRAVFATAFPSMGLESGAPLLVLAPRDESSLKALLPELWKRKGAKPAGLFEHGWEKEYAVVRLDEMAPDAYAVVYHEYVHSLLHLNFRWLPVWLDEGFAELYGYSRFEQRRILVGAPSERLPWVQSHPLIPIDTILEVNQDSPYYRDEDKVQMFYGEAWALTHFLIFGPGMEGGKRFNQFFRLVQQGDEQKKAFHQVFGDPATLQFALNQYVHKFAMTVWVMNNPPHTEEKDFAARTLTVAETEAELASFHLFSHDPAAARGPASQALADDPKLGLAHEDAGFLAFSEGKDEEASREFAQAYELDPKLYLSYFYRLMLSPAARGDGTADRDAMEDGLVKTLAVNPEFAPAYVELARLYVRRGDPTRALAQARKAEQLEPMRAGYHLLSGQILLRMGRGAEAAGFAKEVADRWSGPDHNEAVELWNSIPAEQRPPGEAPRETGPAGSQAAQGRVVSVACGPPEQGLTLVLEHDGQPLRFHAQGSWLAGFSDTLWYGEDHFSLCHHLEGLRAIVHYRPASDKSYTGELMEVEVRDDLPPAKPAKSEEETAKP